MKTNAFENEIFEAFRINERKINESKKFLEENGFEVKKKDKK
jgi:hypothetical protein